MTTLNECIELTEGWTCWIELQQGEDGFFNGKAEIRQGRTQRCVLVIARQPTREAALARVRRRADQFVQEWTIRAPSQRLRTSADE